MKLNPDGTPFTSVPRGVVRVTVHTTRDLARAVKRQVTGKGKGKKS
jgi:hypothetical protein